MIVADENISKSLILRLRKAKFEVFSLKKITKEFQTEELSI